MYAHLSIQNSKKLYGDLQRGHESHFITFTRGGPTNVCHSLKEHFVHKVSCVAVVPGEFQILGESVPRCTEVALVASGGPTSHLFVFIVFTSVSHQISHLADS